MRAVAAAHWGFTLLGAALALLMLALPAEHKPLVVLPALAAQLGWTAWVLRRMRRAGLGFRPVS